WMITSSCLSLQRKNSAQIRSRIHPTAQTSPFHWNSIPASTAPPAQQVHRYDGWTLRNRGIGGEGAGTKSIAVQV
ncbi:MAG: hypothetical protein MJE68_20030, partial [Proteobacteria bacterium]|nr:hypothetical protein [Pseudomonadota bacterium]